MKTYKKTFTLLLFLYPFFFTSSIYAEELIRQPLLNEPHLKILRKDSIINVPITIPSDEIKKVILREMSTPVISGKYVKKPFHINYKVQLQNLNVSFEGSNIKISSRYLLKFSVDYQDKLKGVLNGKVYTEINLISAISIKDDATFMLDISKKEVNTIFTKVEVPSALARFDFLKITKAERYLADKFLKDIIDTKVLTKVREQISKIQVDIKLQQRIQKLVYKNSFATPLGKDLWLLPRPVKVSISQVSTKDNLQADELYINIGITAQPKLITSISKPISKHSEYIPIVIESFEPKIYLYPAVHIEYKYMQQRIEKELNKFIQKNYNDLDYYIDHVILYPSDNKLIISIDLIETNNPQEILTFYLWGEPKLDTKLQTISLHDFDYTLDSKNVLIHTAKWILDDGIKNLIHEKATFTYKEKLEKLFKKIEFIEKSTKDGTLKGNTDSITIDSIHISKNAFILYVTAKGSLSYTIKLNTKENK